MSAKDDLVQLVTTIVPSFTAGRVVIGSADASQTLLWSGTPAEFADMLERNDLLRDDRGLDSPVRRDQRQRSLELAVVNGESGEKIRDTLLRAERFRTYIETGKWDD